MSEWIEWTDGRCPVEGNIKVEIATRTGATEVNKASAFIWSNDASPHDIVRYRVIDQAEHPANANDKQISGDHYKVRPIQPWDYIAANNIPYFEGNAIKYLTRWRDKGGIADLEKAKHYIEKLIELEQSK